MIREPWCRIESEEQLKILLALAKEGGFGEPVCNRGKGKVGDDFLFLNIKNNCIDVWPHNSEHTPFVSFTDMCSLLKGEEVMATGTLVCDTFKNEHVAEMCVELANKAGVKVDAGRPWSKTSHMVRLENGVLSFGTWARTSVGGKETIIDDLVAALAKPALLFGKLPATVEGNNVTVDYEGTKITIAKKRLKEALTWVEGFSEQNYNVGVVTKKSGDTVTGVGLQIGCQLVTVDQLKALVW